MGSKQSKSSENKKTTSTTQPSASSPGTIMNGRKDILLLHKSAGPSQLKVVNNFKDALATEANGSVRVKKTLNIAAEENELSEDLSWLGKMNNVLLICLTSEAFEQLEKILRAKGFADKNGNLHEKIFTISFGDSSLVWPPKGMKNSTQHARDFFFGFLAVENLKPKDFEKSGKMAGLVAAIKGTS